MDCGPRAWPASAYTQSLCEFARMKTVVLFSVILALLLAILVPDAFATLMPRAPHFQYFERPRLRYPFYDEYGRGRLLYGYGGNQLYRYTTYSYLEGVY